MISPIAVIITAAKIPSSAFTPFSIIMQETTAGLLLHLEHFLKTICNQPLRISFATWAYSELSAAYANIEKIYVPDISEKGSRAGYVSDRKLIIITKSVQSTQQIIHPLMIPSKNPPILFTV